MKIYNLSANYCTFRHDSEIRVSQSGCCSSSGCCSRGGGGGSSSGRCGGSGCSRCC